MRKYRLMMEVEAESEEDAMLDFNENIPEFEDFTLEDLGEVED